VIVNYALEEISRKKQSNHIDAVKEDIINTRKHIINFMLGKSADTPVKALATSELYGVISHIHFSKIERFETGGRHDHINTEGLYQVLSTINPPTQYLALAISETLETVFSTTLQGLGREGDIPQLQTLITEHNGHRDQLKELSHAIHQR